MRQDIFLRLLIFTISFITAWSVNEINLSKVKENKRLINAKSTENEYSIWSIDNEYYVSPVHSYLKGTGWKRAPGLSEGDYFRRVPGYSLLYLSFVAIDAQQGIKYLMIFQLLLFGLSSILFFEILRLLLISDVLCYLVTALYVLLPNFYAYAYFTLTEAITPTLVLIALYGLLKHISTQQSYYLLLSSCFLAVAVYTRPLALIIFAIYIPLLVQKPLFLKAKLFKMLLICMPLLTFASIWTTRNYIISGRLIFLEQRNHPQNKDYYKPAFESLCMLYYAWGFDSNEINPLFLPLLQNDSDKNAAIQKFLQAIPKDLHTALSKDVEQVLKTHVILLQQQAPYYSNNRVFPMQYHPLELEVCKRYQTLENKVKVLKPFTYYVIGPAKRLGSIVFHSNTSGLLIFENDLNGFTFAIKAFNKIFHISCYLISFIGLIHTSILLTKGKNINLYCFALGIVELIVIGFFLYVFKATEQRYMLFFLPLVMAFDTYYLQYVYTLYNKQRPNPKVSGDKV